MTDLRAVISDHWAVLDTTARDSTWLTSELPVSVGNLPVLCALGPEGHRHLLVPVPSGDYVRSDTRAAAVRLQPLSLQATAAPVEYANLVLLRDDLLDIFTGLCSDVVAALAEGSNKPLLVVAQLLDGWRELFRGGTQLGVEQLAGLFGELVFLNSLLDRDLRLLKAWKGPLRAPHDFVVRDRAVEIKATASSEGRLVRIHGSEQLAPPPGGELVLRWVRLATTNPAGVTVPDLVDSTAGRIERPQELWHLLARAGYLLADRHRYEGLRFSVVEEAWFQVTNQFPRIVPSSFIGGLPAGISGLRYTVDLDHGPAPMQKEEVADFLRAMAG